MTQVPLAPPRKLVDVEIDGATVRVPDDATILDACRAEGIGVPWRDSSDGPHDSRSEQESAPGERAWHVG